jgi:Flp pilus assembly pilin Flp
MAEQWQNVAGYLLLNGRLMKKHLQKLVLVVRKQSGQGLVEDALILALIAVVPVLVLQGLGSHINNTLSSVNANRAVHCLGHQFPRLSAACDTISTMARDSVDQRCFIARVICPSAFGRSNMVRSLFTFQ